MRGTLLAISNHADIIGGGEYSFLDLVSGLRDSWDILALTPGYGELCDRLRNRSVPTAVSPLSPIRPWLLHSVFFDAHRIVGHCRIHRANLVYANGSRAALYGGLAAKLLHIPMIWHCRVAVRDPRLDPVLQRLSSKIVVNSRATANRLSNTFGKKVCVVYNGIGLSKFRSYPGGSGPVIEGRQKTVISVGRISRQKRHDLVLTAFESLAEVHGSIHLFFIGGKDGSDPAWYASLQTRTARSKFRDRIHWVGHVDDVRPWYHAADLMMFPAENESFGRVVIEAMACGLPVVAAKSGGLPEIITHGEDGFLFSHGNVSQLIKYAAALLDDTPTRERISGAARDRSRYFSLDRHLRHMNHVFTETLSARKGMARA